MGNGAALNGTVGLLRWEPWLDRLRLMAGSEDEDEDEDLVGSCDLVRFISAQQGLKGGGGRM